MCLGLLYLHMHLSRVMGTHYGVFRIGSHTQRGTLGPINGPTASMVFSTVSLCGFFFSMFLWIYLYHFFFYHFISIAYTHNLCGCFYGDLFLLCLHTHFMCVGLFSLYPSSFDTNTHILCVWSCSFSTLLFLIQTHTFYVCG